MALSLDWIFLHLGQPAGSRVISSSLLRRFAEPVQRFLRGRQIIHAQGGADEGQSVLRVVWLKIEHFASPVRSRAISGAVRDLGHGARGVRVDWIHLQGATCAQSRRFHIPTV